ncbi:MAG: hypothetical protein M3198_05180 [Actinomycetota bacterium]|nr:hypothetical protein [Actinomycetota bacterium]
MPGDDLGAALVALGLEHDLPTLSRNAADSMGVLSDAEAWLREKVPTAEAAELDVVVLGSFARLEASLESDFDYLIMVHGLPSDVRAGRRLLEAIDDFIRSIRTRGPGRTGLFGHITAAADLTERIGLEQDTNLSQSRRLLLLEESRSVYQPELHDRLLRAVLERYLADYGGKPKAGAPRFLLNDVQRYWYTLAVDYQAKRWEDASSGWGLRYLKLLNSRKVAYAGTLVSLLRCDDE